MILVILVVSAILLTHLLRDVDWTLFCEIAPFYLVLILLLSALGTALYTVAVYVLVRASGYHTTMAQAYLVLTSSLSVNYVTPIKFGIPLRVYLCKQFMQIPLAVGTALVALETWLGMLVTAAISCVGTALLFPEIGLAVPLTLLATLLVGMGVMLFIKPSLINPLLERLPLQKLTLRLVRFGETVQMGLRSVPLWWLGVVALLFGLNVAAAATRLYLVLLMLEWTVNWPALLTVLSISITAGNLSMIPMGLGVRDASLTLLLMQLGVPNEVALSVAVIQRLFAPGWPLLLGIISTNVLGVSELIKRGSDAEATVEES
ncbi:MAG: lysylphosphatidylglycerol synthase transmembrane domain-containing protein [Chloroflexota bacterium]|nr:lysylphosphatidylglycerol synthase transmembrane domain-containing protein [Chloroflexota bacterium]